MSRGDSGDRKGEPEAGNIDSFNNVQRTHKRVPALLAMPPALAAREFWIASARVRTPSVMRSKACLLASSRAEGMNQDEGRNVEGKGKRHRRTHGKCRRAK